MKNMDAQLASNSPQKRDSGGLEANKYLIFPVLDAAGFQNWRTNYSFFSVLFADLTSAGSWQALGWRTIDASLAVLFARGQSPQARKEVAASLERACEPGQANNRRVFGCFVRPGADAAGPGWLLRQGADHLKKLGRRTNLKI